jgi:hypothetical protein
MGKDDKGLAENSIARSSQMEESTGSDNLVNKKKNKGPTVI